MPPESAFAADGLAAAALQAVSAPAQANVQAASSAWDGTADTDWYNTRDTTFTITTARQLAGLAQIASGTAENIDRDTFRGKTILLASDLTLGDDAGALNWVPIADINRADADGSTTDVYFDGTFDGQGHKLYNLNIDGTKTAPNKYGGYQGLFGALGENAVVRNVGVESGTVKGRVVGGIAAVSHVSSAAKAPLIVGCYNKATIEGNGSTSRGAGGIFGGENQNSVDERVNVKDAWRAAARIVDCYNMGTVSATISAPVGGIAGTGSIQMNGCYNVGAVQGGTMAGALAGNIFAKGYVALQNTDTPYACDGWAKNSYALDDTSVNLFRVYDADHDPDNPGAPSTTGTAAFHSATELQTADAARMGAAYCNDSLANPANDRFPLLYWQAGLAPIAIGETYVAPIPDQRYSAAPITPDVAVYAGEGGDRLVEGADYQVRFQGNSDVGKAVVVIDGLGRYAGTRSDVTFNIVQIDLSACSIDDISAQWFYGDPVKPAITVRTPDGTKLKETTDYTVSYERNDAAGTATATVHGAGVGTVGEKSADFRLVGVSSGLEGEGTQEKPYLISSKADLQFLSFAVNSGLEDEKYNYASYRLTCNVNGAPTDDSPVSIDPIGMRTHPFGGTFDGAGNTITIGMSHENISDYIYKMEGESAYMNLALFCSVPDGRGLAERPAQVVIRDLTVDGSISSKWSVSAFVGSAYASDVLLENCTNKAAVSYDNSYKSNAAAGFVSNPSWYSSIAFVNCRNEGAVAGEPDMAAGFVGEGTSCKLSFEDCVNAGSVEGFSCAGGFIGVFKPNGGQGQGANFQLAGCSNTGAVVAVGDASSAGGLLGAIPSDGATYSDAPSSIESSFNAGAVSAGRAAGGIAGLVTSTPVALTNVYNTGAVSISDKEYYAGGLVGFMTGWTSGSDITSISSCYNAGALDSAGENSGGLVGIAYFYAQLSIANSYYLQDGEAGTIEGDVAYKYAGGGQGDGAAKITGAGTAVSSADLKAAGSEGGAAKLGGAFMDDDGATPLNGGYPVLFWQRNAQRTDIADAGITVAAIPAQTYTGLDQKPPVEVRDTAKGGALLVEGSDYTLSYDNNRAATGSENPAVVTIRGAGLYKGVRKVSFAINPMPIDRTVIADVESQWANSAEPAEPSVAAKHPSDGAHSSYTLKQGSDYELTYANNAQAGTATVTVTGKGNYAGTATKQFTVNMAAEAFAGGTGKAADPYLIATPEQLELAAIKVNRGRGGFAQAHYRLTADIDRSQPARVDAIGTKAVPFQGSFDGDGHVVSVSGATQDELSALFGVTSNANVENVVTAGEVNFSATSWTAMNAALVNEARAVLTVSNCINRAQVYGGYANGGLVGLVEKGAVATFESCRNEGAIGDGDGFFCGGLAGVMRGESMDVLDCANTGAVRVDEDGGGLVGLVSTASSQIKLNIRRSYNTGAVTGNLGLGGLVGDVQYNTALVIREAYSTGSIAGAGLEDYAGGIGGLVGSMAAGTLTIEGVYNAGEVRGNASAMPGGLVGELGGRVSSGSSSNAYFITGMGAGTSIGYNEAASFQSNATSATADELKSADVLKALGASFGPDKFSANGGFPILLSQKTAIDDFAPGIIARQTYTGAEVRPVCTLTNADTGSALVFGEDFDIVYEDNVAVGWARATLVGIGAYRGSVETQFQIAKANIGDCAVAPIADQVLPEDGTGAKPALTITNSAGITLREGVDFAATYSNNTAVGTAHVAIAGRGGYEGNASADFAVVERKLIEDADVADVADQVYTGVAVKPAVAVSHDGADLEGDVDFTVEFADNVLPGQARAIVRGVGYYKGTVEKTFAIRRANMADAEVAPVPSCAFTGNPQTPQLQVSYAGRVLKPGDDYVVSYSGNVSPGTAAATISGCGAFEGARTVLFVINPGVIVSGMVSDVAAQTYTGDEIRPAVQVKLGATTLKYGTDYLVYYGNNVEPGTASVTVRGIGGYSGTVQKTFAVNRAAIQPANVSDIAQQTYAGAPLTPQPVVKVGKYTLIKDVDYRLSYSGNGGVGTGSVTVEGMGCYAGSVVKRFSIVAAASQGASSASSSASSASSVSSAASEALKTAGKGASKASYRITGSKTVQFTSSLAGAKAKSVTVPSTVKISGKTYKVTSIAKGAFKKATKATTVVVGANVSKIAASAFANSKVVKLVVKSKKLSKKASVKSSCKSSKVATVQVKVGSKKLNASYVKKYKKVFTKKNLATKAKTVKVVR